MPPARSRVEDRDAVAEQSQVVRRGEPTGTASDDRDAPVVLDFGARQNLLVVLAVDLVDDVALEPAD
ncbi:MAG: hypothetical protein ACOC2Q_02265, partial [Spirochaetota bacterium]